MDATEPSIPDLFRAIIGEQLGAVTFVQDYLQLHFDGPTVNVTTELCVVEGETRIRHDNIEFRNALCRQIAKLVAAVTLPRPDVLAIEFVDGCSLEFDVSPEGDEALYYHDAQKGSWFVLP